MQTSVALLLLFVVQFIIVTQGQGRRWRPAAAQVYQKELLLIYLFFNFSKTFMSNFFKSYLFAGMTIGSEFISISIDLFCFVSIFMWHFTDKNERRRV